MERRNLRKPFPPHFPKCGDHEFIEVSEGRHPSKRYWLSFCTESTSQSWEERKEKWNFMTVFSILKEEHDHNFHSDVIYSHAFLGKSIRDS